MELTTPLNITPLNQTIVYGDGLLFLGSCFADEIGCLCKGLGFNAQVNPFGVLYNPVSIAQSIFRLHEGKPFTTDEVIQVGEGYYCTFYHNTAFWNPSEESLLDHVNQNLAEAHRHFNASRWIIISLGTSWAFRRLDTLQVVSNCHKLPSNRFDRVFLDLSTTVKVLSDVLKSFPDKQFVFTVSPLRHLKDGLHENQLSKAALLLAVDQVCQTYHNSHYFPAYEILLDELRDYRFYKEDMIHPTDQAVRYIFERFVDFAVNPSQKPAMKKAAELKQMLHHKPLFPESEAYKKFKDREQQVKDELISLNHNIVIDNLISSS